MTVAYFGLFMDATIYGQGTSIIDWHGGMVLPNGSVVGMTVQGEEVGKCSLNAIGYFASEEE
jgi:hypothetical protein